MTSRADRCLSPVELERAYWSTDPRARDHAGDCDQCGARWAEIEALAGAARRIRPEPSTPERRDELRTTILSKLATAATPTRRRTWFVIAPLVAAAAAVVVYLAWPRLSDQSPEPAIATVLDHGGAQYLRTGTSADEIVRLTDGALSIAAADHGAGQRLRVITGDAEIDGAGAAFDVTVKADRLIAIRVMRGTVLLRSSQAQPIEIHAGEVWPTPEVAVAPAAPVPEPIVAPPTPEPAVAPPITEATAPTRVERHRRPAPTDTTAPAEPAVDPPADPVPVDPTAVADAQIEAQAEPPPPQRGRSAGQQAFDDGWAAIRRGDFAAAATAFEKAEAGTDRAVIEDAAYWRAVALARAGRSEGAERAFTRYLDTYPKSVRAGEASVMLGWMLFERGDAAGAERRFKAAVQDRSAAVRRSAAEGLAAVHK